MELLGFMVLFFVVVAAMSSSSSEIDEAHSSTDSLLDNRARFSNQGNQQNDENDRYGRPNTSGQSPNPFLQRHSRQRFRSMVLAFFMGVLTVSVVAAGVVSIYNIEITPSGNQKSKHGDGKTGSDSLGTKLPVPAGMPQKVYEVLKKPHMVCLKKTDFMSFREIQSIYPKRNIEAFLDSEGRYWACIFAYSSEELDEIVGVLRYRENDLIEHGLSLTYYPSSSLCTGVIVREKGTDIWFCKSLLEASR
ncbi:MAG: hypothetical protein ACKVT2_10280 [Saprospiraceae bacterium]